MRRVAALVVCLLLASWQAAAAGAPTVVLLSWDGVRFDYPERAPLPALARMARDGARATRLVPPFPSSTFPSHVTLATGARVDRHGIVGNAFRDRERGPFVYQNDASWIRAEPLWCAAERQGVRSAVFFWVGSETPWEGVAATYRKAPFDAGVGEDEKVRQILAWLDLPAAERPRLIMSWWHGADAEGHRDGPDAASVTAAMVAQDAALGALLAGLDARGLWDDVTLVVVSDHGMTTAGEAIDVRHVLADAGIAADVWNSEAVATIWLAEPARREAALRVLERLDGVRAYPVDGLPPDWHFDVPDRVGDVVAVAEPPRMFAAYDLWQRLQRRVALWLGRQQGAHGYDPRRDDMGGVLFALGRGVPAGTALGVVSALDVAPTVAALLGIAPPRAAEGRALAAIAGR
ncbi:MAG: alkaline phosphatase family protein [bacterium]|nr:alkaline phosphatase family protein [bacterium]